MFPPIFNVVSRSRSGVLAVLGFALLAAAVAPATSTAAPLLVYSLAEKSGGLSYFHNPAKPMILKKEAVSSISFVVRDMALRHEMLISTAVEGKSKYFLLPLAVAGNFDTTVTSSYDQESRFLPYLSNTPTVGVEMRNRFELANGRALTLTFLGRDAIFSIANPLPLLPKNVIPVKAPLAFTITGRQIWEREIPAPPAQTVIPHAASAVTHLLVSGSMKLSSPYTTAVNNADAKDLTAPAGLVPGSFPYAAYRIGKLLQAAKYLPRQQPTQ